MKPFNKEEYNIMCAEFMGGVKEVIPEGGLAGYKEGTVLWSYLFSSHKDPVTYLDFDDDWNWIMEVVEKIQFYKALIISINHCEIHFMPNDGIRINVGGRTTKEAVVQAIWEFLNWYKKQQK